jgi:hypothetical protein
MVVVVCESSVKLNFVLSFSKSLSLSLSLKLFSVVFVWFMSNFCVLVSRVSQAQRREDKRSGRAVPTPGIPDPFLGPEIGGSFDDGDPLTTNLYVGNLPPHVRTEQSSVFWLP